MGFRESDIPDQTGRVAPGIDPHEPSAALPADAFHRRAVLPGGTGRSAAGALHARSR